MHCKCPAVARALFLLLSDVEGARFPFLTVQDGPKCILIRLEFSCNLALWRLALPEFNVFVVYRASIVHQAADSLFGLRTSRTDQTPMEDDIPGLCITVFIFPRKRRDHVCVHANLRGNNDKERNGLHEVYALQHWRNLNTMNAR